MKIISKTYWKDRKNFIEQISIKFGDFYYLMKMNLFWTVPLTSTPKYREKFLYRPDIQKVKYRLIISVNRYIVRSLVWTVNFVNSCVSNGMPTEKYKLNNDFV